MTGRKMGSTSASNQSRRRFRTSPRSQALSALRRIATVCRKKLCRHLVQRDVPPLLDQSDDEGFMRIEDRAAPPTLRTGRPLACPGPGNPSDRGRNPEAEPGRGLSCRQALRRSLQNTHAKIVTQSSRHPSPPSTGRLNQHDPSSSHHNRFNDQRKRSSSPSDL
jgi:hypothetical protein